MTRYQQVFVVALILGSLPSGEADAQQVSSVSELVAIALDRAPEIQAARMEIEAARGRVVQARLRPNPRVSSERREEVGGFDTQSMVSVEVPLDLFRRSGRLSTAERTADVIAQSVADRERLLAASVRSAAGLVLAGARRLSVLNDLIDLNRRFRDLLAARVAQGGAAALERDLAAVDVDRLEADRALQAGRVDAAMIDLKALVGLAPDAPLALGMELEAVVRAEAATVGEAAPAAGALAARPDVRESLERVRFAEAQLDERRREARFDMSVYAGYMRMNAGFPQQGLSAANALEPIRGLFHNVAVGVSVMVPLRNRNQGAIVAAEAERRGAERMQAARELSVRAEMASASVRDRQAHRSVEIYVSGARDLARRNLDVVRQSYELGRNTVFDVLAEQRRLLDFERAYTEALAEAFDARTALRRASGDVR